MSKNVIRLPLAVVENVGRPSRGEPAPEVATDRVYVIYTDAEETLAAVRVAERLATTLDVPVSVVDFRLVSFPAQMEEPDGISPAESEPFLERLRAEGSDIEVRVFVCRDGRQAVSLAFKPHSLIVVGGHHHHGWRSSTSEQWRRLLEGAGHYVVFVDTSARKEGAESA